MSRSPFEGKWKLHSSENYDEFMRAMGAPGFVVSMVAGMRPKLEVRVDEDHYRFKMIFPLRSQVDEFTIDEEFEDEKMYGLKIRGVVRQQGRNRLVEYAKEGNLDVKTTREVDDDELIITWEVGDVVAVRTFRRERD